METTLNMARGLLRRRYVPNTSEATGTTEGTSISPSKAEGEETEVSTVWLSYGVSQATYPAVGLRGL